MCFFSWFMVLPWVIKARAIENQCYVIAAAQYGRHNEKRESFGHSLAVDPWGRIIADAGGYPVEECDPTEVPTVAEPPAIVTVEIDLDLIESTRQRMPIEQHRQNAVFSFQE
jgi:predicted amidohydrolase